MSEESVINLRNATIAHRDQEVLTDVSVQIQSGEFIYLIGRTASGKSSLIKTLTGELPLTEGEGTVCGFDLPAIKDSQIPHLRRSMGIVFQDFQLLTDRTVYSNLQFVLKATGWNKQNEIDARIGEVLQKVGLTGKEKSMPNQLSGGEQQRVVIARALLNNPNLIIADEPTGHLDPDTSFEIANLLHDISKGGKTVVMATHNYGLLKRFPARTIKCENGIVNEQAQEEIEIDFDDL